MSRTLTTSLVVLSLVNITLISHASAATMAYETAVLADNPIAYWRMNEVVGTTMTDISGNSHDGIYSGGVTLGAAGVGGGASDDAATFNGTSGLSTVADSDDFNFLNFTIEAWIQLEDPFDTNNRVVSHQGSQYWLFHVLGTGGDVYNLAAWSSLDAIAAASYGPDLNDGEYHHIALTRDTVNDRFRWYVDGVKVGEEVITNNTAYTITSSLLVGAYISGPSQFFPGEIDEVALYNVALSTASINAHFDAGTFVPVVPEPSSFLLLGLGTLGLIRHVRRRRRRA